MCVIYDITFTKKYTAPLMLYFYHNQERCVVLISGDARLRV